MVYFAVNRSPAASGLLLIICVVLFVSARCHGIALCHVRTYCILLPHYFDFLSVRRSLCLYEESTRTLDVLDADGPMGTYGYLHERKTGRFGVNAKNTHTLTACPVQWLNTLREEHGTHSVISYQGYLVHATIANATLFHSGEHFPAAAQVCAFVS